VLAPVVADRVPTAGDIDQSMVAVLPVRVAVNATAAPPAVTVAVVGLSVSPGDGVVLSLLQPAAIATAKSSAGIPRVRVRMSFSLFRVGLKREV
jgi:hypothetical protein